MRKFNKKDYEDMKILFKVCQNYSKQMHKILDKNEKLFSMFAGKDKTRIEDEIKKYFGEKTLKG